MNALQLKEWAQRPAIGTWPALVLIAAGMQTLILQPLAAATLKNEITDGGITSVVEKDLILDKGVSPNGVNVSTSQGIVLLSGSVNNLLARKRSVKIAESIRGVRGVIDHIAVTPVSRPDEAVRKDVLSALLNDPATESYQIGAVVADGIVTLTGSVGSMAESRLAQQIAEGVKGVKDVRNDVRINYTAKRTDAEIAADIQAVLQWDIWVAGYPIHVEVHEGHVALIGAVGSVVEKSRVDSDVWVNGVTAVDDSGLKVEPNARGEFRRRSLFVNLKPEAITRALRTSFRADPRVARYADKIKITVENGVAILDGAVENLKAKAAAEQDARDIVGVSWVDDVLSVRPTMNMPSDDEAQKGLRAALVWDPELDGTKIEAAVINHVAYLDGTVDAYRQIAEARDIAERTKGVVEVRNHLKMVSEPEYFFYNQPYYDFAVFGPPPPKSDALIKKDIEREFFWSPFVHRNDITVRVDGGVAMLSGKVGSWMGYEEAYRDALKGGASTVIVKNLHVAKGAWF